MANSTSRAARGEPLTRVCSIDQVPDAIRRWLIVTPSGCWEWQRSRTKHGHGTIFWEGHPGAAHRVVYRLLVDPELPPGDAHHHLDHLCRNPPCCNPAHLEPVSARINAMRRWQPSERSPYFGVHRKGRQWEAKCTNDLGSSWLGTFKDPRQAYEVVVALLDRIDPIAGLEARRLSGPTKRLSPIVTARR